MTTVLRLPTTAVQSGRAGWTVRVNWADGTHELIGFHPDRRRAERKLRSLARWWTPGPARPYGYAVLAIEHTRWKAHTAATPCADDGCPFSASS